MKTTIITNLTLDGGQGGKSLFKRAQESSGVPMGFHSLVGKTIELKSLRFANKTYFGLIVGGRNDYIHKETGETMFSWQSAFLLIQTKIHRIRL